MSDKRKSNGLLTTQQALKVYITHQANLHRQAAAAAAAGANESEAAEFNCPTKEEQGGSEFLGMQKLALDCLSDSIVPAAKEVLDFW